MKKLKLIIIAILFIVITIAMAIYFNPDKNTNKVEKKDYKSIEISPGEQVYTYNSYIYIYGKGGIKVINDEKVVLQDTFSVENPYISTAYNRLAIGDRNGKVIRVYSNEGHMYTINEPTNVLGFSINKNGYLSTILKNETNYEVKVYSNTGENAYFVKDITYNEGVPFSVSVSEDNNILAVSYIKTTGATIDSNIVFYSIKEDQVFGGYIRKDQMVNIIKFVGNTNLVSISDKEIFIIKCNSAQTSEQVKEIYKKPLNNILKEIGFLDGIGYSICYGHSTTHNKEAMQENTVVFYNQAGGEIGKFYAKDLNISNMSVSKFGAILQDGRLFTAVNTLGKKLWEYQATQDIKEVRFYDNDNKALIVTNNEIKIVKIDKVLLDKQIDPNNTEQTTDKETEKSTKDENNKQNTNEETTKKDTNSKEETTNNNSNTKDETKQQPTKDEKVETTTKDNKDTNKKEEKSSTTTEKVEENQAKQE